MMDSKNSGRLVLATLALVAAPVDAEAASPPNEFFEKNIRPVLVAKCYGCHSAKSGKKKGGLLVDSRDGLLAGGETGPAIVPRKPAESLLLNALNYDAELGIEMPPSGRLSDSEIALFEKWITMGAPDPRLASKVETHSTYVSVEEGRKFWAYKSPVKRKVPVPRNGGWSRNDIDRFVLARLESENLEPVDDADRYTLLRRVTFDLTGLPPTPDEIRAFVEDRSPVPKALEKVVDTLLESEAFGERWGRHWLDIARYAESNGSTRDYLYHHAWRYRDYVIDAFNDDKPYDEFVREQIAGDLMSGDTPEQRDERRIATGFMALASKDLLVRSELEQSKLNIGAEQIDVTSRAFMATTIGCAQCHYHKFDPMPQEDFYALYGIFRSSQTVSGISGRGGHTDSLELIPLEEEPSSAQRAATARIQADINKYGPPLAAGYLRKRPAPDSKQGQNAQKTNRRVIADLARIGITVPEKFHRLDLAADAQQGESSKDANAILAKTKMAWVLGAPFAMGIIDRDEPHDVPLFTGGEPDKPEALVERGFPKVMDYPGARPFTTNGSGRLELAEWMTHANHPLTARVMVNRVWGHLFGRAIVSTVDNFGTTGARPSHPELLDHLAVEFAGDGWSVKRLIKRIVLSRAYGLRVENDPRSYAIDPGNNLFWRANAKRLEAEAIRDSLLVVSGQLESRPQASPFALVPTLGKQGGSIDSERFGFEVDRFRARTVYAPVLRHDIPAALDLFDFPDPNILVGQRDVTTSPVQALYLMNSGFVRDTSSKAAERFVRGGLDDATIIERIYLSCLGRMPDSEDRELIADYLAAHDGDADRVAVWSSVVKQVFGSAEFRYLY